MNDLVEEYIESVLDYYLGNIKAIPFRVLSSYQSAISVKQWPTDEATRKQKTDLYRSNPGDIR